VTTSASTPAVAPRTEGTATDSQVERAFWPVALTGGVLVGALSAAFHGGLNVALQRREQLTEWLKPLGVTGVLLLVVVCATAVGVAVWMTGRFAPQAAGSGIQHIEGVVRGVLPRWPLSVVWVKFVGGVLGIGGGLVLGREGPTVQMGASLAHELGVRCRLSEGARQTLLIAGAGAGLAGAFNAPLAGTLLVIEEFKCELRPGIYLGTLLASLITDQFVRWTLGSMAELPLRDAVPPAAALLAPVCVVGVLSGILAAGFNALLLAAFVVTDRWRRRMPAWILGAAMGAVLGVVAWFIPTLPGGGVWFAASVMDGSVPTANALWLLPLSLALTVGSYVIGAPGGIFAPLLVMGALLGLAVHGGCAAVIPAWAASMPTLAAAGMAGLFAGIVRAPLTGAVLLIEMTGSYALVLPLVAASLAGYAVAAALGSKPVYESLLERETARRHGGG
jgi:CIC family chloride channel protein